MSIISGISLISETTHSGLLLSWGCGEFGQHGHGHHHDVSIADSEMKFFRERKMKVRHIACGASHSIAVTDKNEIFTWGNGKSGQLGSNDSTSRSLPQRIRMEVLLEPVVRFVDCGSRHTVVLTESGRIFTCGNNFNAQLGYDFRASNYKQHQFELQLSASLQHQKVDQVACGSRHTLFLFRNGTVASCGNNSYHQLGQTDRTDTVVPKVIEDIVPMSAVACGSNHCLSLDNMGHVYMWGYGKALGRSRDVAQPRRINLPRRITAIACGHMHSMLLSGSGHVFTFGNGIDGQLGHGKDVSLLASPVEVVCEAFSNPMASISAGECFSAAVTANGELYMWGKNMNKVLSDELQPETVWTPRHVNTQGKPVARVVCGSWHVMALTGMPDWEAVQDSDATQTDTESESVTGCSTPEPSFNDCQFKSSTSTHTTADCREISEEIEAATEEEIAPEPLSLPPLAVVRQHSPVIERVPSLSEKVNEQNRASSRTSQCSSCLRSQTPVCEAAVSPVRSNANRATTFRQRGRGSRLPTAKIKLMTHNIVLNMESPMTSSNTVTSSNTMTSRSLMTSSRLMTSPGAIPGQVDKKFQFKKYTGFRASQRPPVKQGIGLVMHGKQVESSLRTIPGSTSLPSMSDTPSIESEHKRPSTISSGEKRQPVGHLGSSPEVWSKDLSLTVGQMSRTRHKLNTRGRNVEPTGTWLSQRKDGPSMQSTVGRDVNEKKTPRKVAVNSRLLGHGWTMPSYGKS